jgi:FSR family fosmidomycin resistance protein-like MFS transporter
MSLFHDKTFRAAGFAHLAVDILNSQVAILLAYLSGPLQLSNALIGLVSTLYSLSGSLSQPIFGWISDWGRAKSFAVGGVVWMAGCFTVALLIPGRLALIFLIVGALGSAAFHPTGASEATKRGQRHLARLEITAASIFFFFGQGGLFIGPMLGGPLLDRWGKDGLFILFFIVIPAAIYMQWVWQPDESVRRQAPKRVSSGAFTWRSLPGISAFILLIFLRAWTQMSVNAFLPKYLRDLGFRPGIFGPISALFMGGAAIGGVLGGWLADRYGNRIVTFWSLTLAVAPIFGLAIAQDPSTFATLTFIAGVLVGAPHSILIVLAQRMLPGQMGAASGLVLGFTFASGAIGNLFSGFIADWADLPSLFHILAALCGVAAVLALSLKRRTIPSAAPSPTQPQYD